MYIPDAKTIIEALGGDAGTGKCRCPAHPDEKPSLTVSQAADGKVLVYCHTGCSQDAVIDALRQRGLWPDSAPPFARRVTQFRRGDAAVEDELKDDESERKLRHILRAAAIAKKENAGSVASYLRGRGIDAVPECAMWLPPDKNARYNGKRFPAMVVPVIRDGLLVGAQVTHLTAGSEEKLPTDKPRLNRGEIKGGYVPIGIAEPDKPLVVAEGVETAMAASQITGLPAIATLGASFLRSVEPPPCSEIIVAADNDDAGRRAAEDLAVRMCGRRVRIAVPEGPKGYDWNDALKSGADTSVMRRSILQARPFERRFVFGMEEFIDLKFPPREYLLRPWLTTNGLTMVHAPAGAGKTWLALSAGYSVAAGQALMDWHCDRPARVLYVDGELPGALLQNRIERLGLPLPPDQFLILAHSVLMASNKPMPDLGAQEGRDFLDAIIELNRIELIILDSVSTLVRSGMENEAESWRVIQDWSLKHRLRGRAVVYLHHEGRSGKPRGTSMREVVLDSMIKLEPLSDKSTGDETAFKLSFTKSREFYGTDAAPMNVYLSTTTGILEWRSEPVAPGTKERVAEMLDQASLRWKSPMS